MLSLDESNAGQQIELKPGGEARLSLAEKRLSGYRWQIEQFFRWLKCVLNCRHLLSCNQNGVELQVYTALIASMLITLWVGGKPTKRTYEMLCLYFQGWATLAELLRHIQSLKPAKKLES